MSVQPTPTASSSAPSMTPSAAPQHTNPMDVVEEDKMYMRTLFFALAGVAALLTTLITVSLVRRHLAHLSRPREQNKIISIVFLAPWFAFNAFLSLHFQDSAPTIILHALKDTYEAYVVYLFFALLIEYLGGAQRVVSILEARDTPLYRVYPMNRIMPGPLLEANDVDGARRFFNQSRVGVMQFVLVRPLMAVLVLVLNAMGGQLYVRGNLNPKKAFVWIELILINISVTYAVYCLLTFFVALRVELAPNNPVPKFVAVKSVVFLSFWQGIVLAIIAQMGLLKAVGEWTVEDVSTGIQNLLISFEMVAAAIYHKYAFPWQRYNLGPVASRAQVEADAGIGLGAQMSTFAEARRDFGEVFVGARSARQARVAPEIAADEGGPEDGRRTPVPGSDDADRPSPPSPESNHEALNPLIQT